MGPNPVCLVPYKKIRTQTQGDNHVKTEGEDSYLQPIYKPRSSCENLPMLAR